VSSWLISVAEAVIVCALHAVLCVPFMSIVRVTCREERKGGWPRGQGWPWGQGPRAERQEAGRDRDS
jgi:hypothetical protein